MPVDDLFHVHGQGLLNGMFGVGKGGFVNGKETLWLIMNLIPLNRICRSVAGDVGTLPQISGMSAFMLTSGAFSTSVSHLKGQGSWGLTRRSQKVSSLPFAVRRAYESANLPRHKFRGRCQGLSKRQDAAQGTWKEGKKGWCLGCSGVPFSKNVLEQRLSSPVSSGLAEGLGEVQGGGSPLSSAWREREILEPPTLLEWARALSLLPQTRAQLFVI